MDYTLFENKLTKDVEDDYIAKPVNNIIKNRNELIEEITGPGSILKETESKAVIDAYWDQIEKYISEGKMYRDERITVNIGISGVFVGKRARDAEGTAKCNLNLVPNKSLKLATDKIHLNYVDPNYDRAIIDIVYDFNTDSDNDIISPNGVVEIKGRDLKIYEDVEGSGIFFINQETNEAVKVTRIRDNEPKTLLFTAPDLSAGEYSIEIRNSRHDSKKIRLGISDQKYTVK
ncbi:MAG: DUF4469 domain-containing protein [Hyphomicrobiales bacterium]